MGANLLAIFLSAWCLIFNNYSLLFSGGVVALPWIIYWLTSILNDEPKKHGHSIVPAYIMLVLNVLCTSACFRENELWASILWKILILGLLLHAVGFTILPALTNAIWNSKLTEDEENEFIFRTFGYTCLQYGVYLIALFELNMDPVRAMGYGTLVQTIGLLAPILKRDKFGRVQERHRLMALGSAILAYVMLKGSEPVAKDAVS
jgi:hypothetical protein